MNPKFVLISWVIASMLSAQKPCYTTGDGVVLKTLFECGSLSPWIQYSEASNGNWEISSYGGETFAYISGYGNDEPSRDWLISPKLSLSGDENLSFASIRGHSGSDIIVKISMDYDGVSSPSDANWTDLNATLPPDGVGGYSSWVESGILDLSGFAGNSIYIAFYHEASGTASDTVSNWEVDDIVIVGSGSVEIPYNVEISANTTDAVNSKSAFEMGVTAEEPLDEQVPDLAGDLRIATFNAYLNRSSHGELTTDLTSGADAQINNVAEIIQRVRPEVLLINEFDYNGSTNVELLIHNYLKVSQHGQEPIDYPYYFVAPSNTGIATGLDVNNNGTIGTSGQDYGDDSFGFGKFPGQYGLVVLSQYPIDMNQTRTFQKFLWKDMPDNNMPTNEDHTPYYTQDVVDIYRLSSKSHWDVAIDINGTTVHVLVSHPTPPTFDDGDKDNTTSFVVDWNGLRNHDEIRFWKDYINGKSYFYDDNNVSGGLAAGERFVIMGDENADPDEGDSYDSAIMQLLDDELINTSFTPTSNGATSEGVSHRESDDTANWSIRADYVLPSVNGFMQIQSGIFWPKLTDIKHYLVEKRGGLENSSDHRMVWVDLNLIDSAAPTEKLEELTETFDEFTDF
jgi:hypothetical protein